MRSNNSDRLLSIIAVILLSSTAFCDSAIRADRPGWQRQEVNWHMSGGKRITHISYPDSRQQQFRERLSARSPRRTFLKMPLRARLAEPSDSSISIFSAPVLVDAIDSPPIDGFVPWVVATITNKRLSDLEPDAVPETAVVGRYPKGIDPNTGYIIGIFDTGSTAHVIGYADATRAGLFSAKPSLITSNITTIGGVIGAVDAWISQPLGFFVDGLGAIDSQQILDSSGMVGESNVAVVVGQDPGDQPDLPTIIGIPLSVFFTTVINNNREITVSYKGEDITSPDIHIYEHSDPCIPDYANIVPLELRPLGAVGVQYVPEVDFSLDFSPMTPSIIVGNFYQSLFFVFSVDLSEGQKSAIDKNRFLLDTGAQVSVIGSRIAARLALDHHNPDFEVEIQDVTSQSIITPGFFIDSLEIPALGEWLSFTNVPVILLDVSSPEGGTCDGIIGMNLFTEFNLVLRGGGLFLEGDPTLEFERIVHVVGDIAPRGGDGTVDTLDLAALADAWLTTPGSANWYQQADLAPASAPDGLVDFLDYVILTEHWLETQRD